MENANTVNTPMDYKTRLDNVSNNADAEADQAQYQSIVGSLMYAAQATPPDIAFAVAALSRYLLKPYRTHMTAAKRVLRYLKSTADAKLIFSGPGGGSDVTAPESHAAGPRRWGNVTPRKDSGMQDRVSVIA